MPYSYTRHVYVAIFTCIQISCSKQHHHFTPIRMAITKNKGEEEEEEEKKESEEEEGETDVDENMGETGILMHC